MAVPQEQYWTSFLADTKPNGTLTRSSDFALRVWQGIPLESDLRRRVWLQCVARARAEKKGPEEAKEDKVSKDVIEQINMELEPGHFARFNPKQEAGATPDDLDRVKRVLIAHATKQALQEYVEGSAQLVARLLSVMKNSEEDTLAVLQLLTEKMKSFHKNNHVGLRQMVLVLAEIMVRELPELCNHFNTCHFDVVDLSDVVCVWTLPLFSCHFSPGVVKRLVDIVLLDGPDHLIGFVFGMTKVFAPSLLHQTADTIYTVVTELPESLSPQHVAQAFKIGFEVFRARSEMVAEIKAKKNWAKAVEQSGTLTFIKGVGTPLPPQPLMSPVSSVSSSSVLSSLSSPSGNGDARTVSFAANSPKTMRGGAGLDIHGEEKTGLVGPGSTGSSSSQSGGRLNPLPSPSTLTPLSTTSGAATPAELERVLAAADRCDPNDPVAMKRIMDDMRAQLLHVRHGRAFAANGEMKEGGSGSDGEDGPFARGHHQESIAMALLGSGAPSTPAEAKGSIIVPTATTATTAVGSSQHPSERVSGAALKPPTKNAVIRYSELMEYQEFPCVYMEGYLMKSRAPSRIFRRRNSAGFFGNLHRRFFVLQGHFLTYFKSHQQKKPTKDVSVDMRGRRVTLLKNHEFGPFAFQIDSVKEAGPLYLLFASNAAVRDAWIRVLTAASGVPPGPSS